MPARYVVVVHGIGEQRKNETILAVVNRFAEARRDPLAGRAGGLTLGLATGQTGKENAEGAVCRYPPPPDDFRPWLEFAGIPREPGAAVDLGPFLGEPSTSGENLRFVDMWWADVLRRDFPDVGQEPATWTEGLLARLGEKGDEAPPAWARATVREVRELALRVDTVLRTRAQAVRRRIFEEFLGDVQVYGEYAHCRGQSVRRFHRLLARIEAAHAAEFRARHPRKRYTDDARPRYTIVAHSLGSVLSLDALLYAHAREDLRRTPTPGGADLPFPAYVSTADLAAKDPKVPVFDTSWVKRVDALVTLGSPIDKYLVLWWRNYRFLNVPDRWMDAGLREFRAAGNRIRHFNYSDEQDPVGHNLDVAATAPAVREVFDRTEDVVYNRYPVPGFAHVAYWGDRELFAWVLRRAVDQQPGGDPPCWFDRTAYRWALAYSYRLLPLALLLLGYFALSWAFYTRSWHATVLAGGALLGCAWLGGPLLRLAVWWRQIARLKWSAPAWIAERERAARRFRHEVDTLQLLAPLVMVFAFLATGDWTRLVPTPGRIALLAALLVPGFALIARAGARRRRLWTGLVVAALVLARPVRAVAGGDLALNVLIFSSVATVVFTNLRQLIYGAKEELGVAKGEALPRIDYPRYADATGADIPPPPPRRAPPRRKS